MLDRCAFSALQLPELHMSHRIPLDSSINQLVSQWQTQTANFGFAHNCGTSGAKQLVRTLQRPEKSWDSHVFQDLNSTVILASANLDLSVGTIFTVFFFFKGVKNVYPVLRLYNQFFCLASSSMEGLNLTRLNQLDILLHWRKRQLTSRWWIWHLNHLPLQYWGQYWG